MTAAVRSKAAVHLMNIERQKWVDFRPTRTDQSPLLCQFNVGTGSAIISRSSGTAAYT
ncbi:hypothetical protein [Burkholderia sp. Leaf177]|uniref:hypothetical protein n=1 Tax=Burkholderia sp. Leaf177 TaxID=1736287 RepID=UPI000A75F812|nr:hypothetical protein [Burkholderia sp. Leaf177]